MPVLFVVLIVLAIGVDQGIKYFAADLLQGGNSVEAIPNFLSFTYVENRGAAFGMMQGMTIALSVVTGICCVLLLWILFRYRSHNFLSRAACILIVAGGIGNLIDRIRLGYVIDFIKISFFPPVFNFADCCVTVGVILAILHVLLLEMQKKKKEPKADEQTDSNLDS
ncbi:signal peptidase II [Yeguia hominis]|uniref:Lipoprotein signal peptidase n=1 Tax=Yeguia hominis TaxID=2763662 RepID=A0A926HQN0_9FIRM|nr:signal peptidase II [Yeguia hominis]MBC8532909.1 signal peptidase II [Yeguia hominis]